MTAVMAKSITTAGTSSSRSAAKNGCHRRKSPKWTISQMRWKFPPGSESSAPCNASSIAITTQRRPEIRRCEMRSDSGRDAATVGVVRRCGQKVSLGGLSDSRTPGVGVPDDLPAK